ncbi:MAG: lipopolysaccharide assembly protein LapA domain-containing protein [Pseudonocardia sp.]|nr:lipopolysaccharide assembly protein LapA domain-containing protein [Pseudonocardia sp.]
MTEEPTRAMPLEPDKPAHGSVGPEDPHADPDTHPGLPTVRDAHSDPATDPELQLAGRGEEQPTVPVPGADRPHVERTRTGGLYAGLILSAIVLLILLVFILQNLDPVRINFLGFTGSLPAGVAMLMSAIAGLLLVAIPGGLRIWQLRRVARKAHRSLR